MKKINKIYSSDCPCVDCGTDKNIVWFTDSIFWNEIMGKDRVKILCIDCFVKRAEKEYPITGWKLTPEFKQ